MLPALILILSASLAQRQLVKDGAKKDLQARVQEIARTQERIVLQAEQVLILLSAIPAVKLGTAEAEEIFRDLLESMLLVSIVLPLASRFWATMILRIP